MKDEENEFSHQLSSRSIWVIDTLRLGIHLPELVDDLHHLHTIIVSHSCRIITHAPNITQIQELNSLLTPITFSTTSGVMRRSFSGREIISLSNSDTKRCKSAPIWSAIIWVAFCSMLTFRFFKKVSINDGN